MQINCDGFWFVIEERRIVPICFLKLFNAQGVVQIAHMVPEQCLSVLYEADRRLELSAVSNDLLFRQSGWERECSRHAPPRTAQNHASSGPYPLNPIVEPSGDLSVMHQERIRKGGQFLSRLLVPDDLRLTREVARGHHEWATGPGVEEQVVERSIGKHPPECGLPRSEVFWKR